MKMNIHKLLIKNIAYLELIVFFLNGTKNIILNYLNKTMRSPNVQFLNKLFWEHLYSEEMIIQMNNT